MVDEYVLFARKMDRQKRGRSNKLGMQSMQVDGVRVRGDFAISRCRVMQYDTSRGLEMGPSKRAVVTIQGVQVVQNALPQAQSAVRI